MARSELQQAQELINRARHILITFPAGQGYAAVGSSLGLSLALEKLGKRVDVVSADFVMPGSLKFLPQVKRLANEVASLRKFIISLNLERTGLQDLSYNVEDKKLHIYLTPKQGNLDSGDLTTRSSDFSYDLIVTLDTPDLDSLGELFHSNTEFFYQTSILNLDHSPRNEHFGQVNLVDFNSPSTAELVKELLETLDPNLLSPDIATCLYTSLSISTKSFTTAQVTPATLDAASRLVTLGARREEVVKHLYRTKKLPTLKLWGRALARLKNDPSRRLVWSVLQPDDFIKAGAGQEELPLVVDDLITNAPEAGTVVLLYEATTGTTKVFLRAGPGRHAMDLLKPFEPQGDRGSAQATLTGVSLLEAEQRVIEHLKQAIPPLEQA